MSLEDRLRRSLQARAEDVTPDPGMFSVVQSRIRRARTFRLALAGVAATLAIAGVAIAAPNLIDRRIELEPGPVATQPGEDATPTDVPSEMTWPGLVPSVVTDGEVISTIKGPGSGSTPRLGGDAVTECASGPCEVPAEISSFSVRGGTTDHLEMMIVSGDDCGDLFYASLYERRGASPPGGVPKDNVGRVDLGGDECATSAAFSPDGRHVAWVSPRFEDEWLLFVADWSEDGPVDPVSFGLGLNDQASVRIDDWTWTGMGEQVEGALFFRVSARPDISRDPAESRILRRSIARQADGELALQPCEPGCPVGAAAYEEVDATAGYSAMAFSSNGDSSAAQEYVLEIDIDEDGRPGEGRIASGGTFVALDDHILDSMNPDALDDVWLTASGADLLFGTGEGQAWSVHWNGDEQAPTVEFLTEVLHAVVLRKPSISATEPPGATRDVEVYFGMTGADACVADQKVDREVEGPGVARGALTELLKGPSSRESNEGIVSPFNANTAGALRDITIADGQARVDFSDFSADVENDSCTKSAIVDSLNKTLFQFPSVESTLYSFDGDTEAWEEWLGLHSDALTPPDPVVDTQKAIYDAAVNRSWKALRRLSAETSCTMSDQPEPCVPYWKDQEANGADPLGTMVDLLSGGVAKNPNAPIWVYPPEWADPDSGYSGPRIGIDEDGVWRYFVLEGG